MKNLIKKLSDMRGVSGFEYRLNKTIAQEFEPYCDEVRIDPLGSVIGIKYCGKKNAPSVMIEAHCDEIGLIATSVTEDGFITFSNVGGIDPRILPSLDVIIHGKKDIHGIVGIKPDYMNEPGKSIKMRDMAIDTGIENIGDFVSIGDSITVAQSVGELSKTQWSGKTLDDRASLAAIIRTMKSLQNKELNVDVYAIAAVQEEVGLRGGKTTSYGINPTMAIATDVTHGITPDNSKRAFELGKGATISVGPNIHPKLSKRLFETADKYKIKVATEVDGGCTGTDAWEIQTAANGVPTALLSLPLKYMHTSVETIDISDAKAVSDIMTHFIEDLESDTSWLNL